MKSAKFDIRSMLTFELPLYLLALFSSNEATELAKSFPMKRLRRDLNSINIGHTSHDFR